jgi:serpin B
MLSSMSSATAHSLILALGALLSIPACDGEDGDPPEFAERRSEAPHDEDPQVGEAEAEALAESSCALTLDLYAQLREHEAANRGFAISAYSIHSAFAMLYGGTIDPAQTEMATTMHFSLDGERQHVALNWLDAELASRNLPATDIAAAVDLHRANGVWVRDDFADQIAGNYLDLLAIHYDAGVYLARFATQPELERSALNAWVSDRTAGLIPALFPAGSIDTDTALVLVNALYLKAPWAQPFDTEATAPAPFHRLDGSQVEVEMMHNFELSAEYGEGLGYQAIAVPLRGQALELLIIMPGDFATFEAQLDPARLKTIRGAMKPSIVNTSLPKFELAAQLELTDELQALGMVAPFVDDHSFDRIVEKLGVITTVVHQAVIEVDEQGIEAAAATGIVVTVTSARQPEATMVVDRPFVLAIRDAPTGTLLFFGRVLDPSAK